jgi:hypothetical protein
MEEPLQDDKIEELPIRVSAEEPVEVDHVPSEEEVAAEMVRPSSVQISSPTGPASEEEDPMAFIMELGDYVVIETSTYGRIEGTVYYRSLERISIKPTGVSHYLHHFKVEQTDEGEMYDDVDGVIDTFIIDKRKQTTFVEQQNFRVGQMVDTFTSEREPYRTFKIIDVSTEVDSIKLEDPEDTEHPIELVFNGVGIESDEPIAVIRIRPFIAEDESSSEVIEEVPLGEADEDIIEEIPLDIKDVGVIEITPPKIFKEAASYEQRIPDDMQKIDALNDFMLGLDPMVQKDPRTLRTIRILVETLFYLKQGTVSYRKDGSVQGPQTVSLSFLSDLIKHSNIPMGRPVLMVSKKEYSMNEELDELDGDDRKYDPQKDTEQYMDGNKVYFEKFTQELMQMNAISSRVVSSSGKGSTVVEWKDQQDFVQRFMNPWRSMAEPTWKALSDSDFFRMSHPITRQIGKNVHKLQATVPGYTASHREDSKLSFDRVSLAMERALGPTYRKGKDRSKQVLIEEESARMLSYIMFPARLSRHLGHTRSRQLALDSSRSQLPIKTMQMIVEEMGEPKENGTSNDALLLTSDDVGEISIADYVSGMTIPSLGLGDAMDTLDQYGMGDLELNSDLSEALIQKVEKYQEQLISALTSLRESLSSNEPQDPKPNPMLPNPEFFNIILNEPMLRSELEEYKRVNPSLATSDIGQVSHLMKHVSNYFQVAAGQNKVLVGTAFLQAGLTEYLKQLKIANLIRYNHTHAGERPKKNMCKHVADLVSVQKIRDDGERFRELSQFVKRYQGVRSSNWTDCRICKQHLICIHERLQLQAYLNPKEKETIEKQIILTCSGGQFQGKYICRNCGQSLRDLDFDNNLEFDDDGKPKSGRSVLVDEDEVLEKKLDLMVSVPIEPSQKQELELTEDEVKCYHVIRELAERVGVQLENDGYRTVIDDVMRFMNQLSTREEYGVKKKIAYEVFVVRFLITSCAAFLLIEIQTKIPSYLVRYTLMGCNNPGFEGYPLERDKTNMQGVEYMACAISSIMRRESPWGNTGFQSEPDDIKRMKGIVAYIDNILSMSEHNAVIQGRLSMKRRYLLEVFGKASDEQGGYSKESIPSAFLPEQVILTPEDAAKEVIHKEVMEAMGNSGRNALMKLWIRQAHLVAKTSAKLVKGAPLSETTCCTVPISAAGTFWKEQGNFPEMHARQLVPNQQGSFMLTSFEPRDAGVGVVEPNKDLYYRLFLKCCFTGPRIGHLHEPGLTHRCTWCGFQFPGHPKVIDTNTEGRGALSEVNTTTEEFNKLLDAIHEVNRVEPIKKMEISSLEVLMEQFGSVSPPPFQDWKGIIDHTTQEFMKLPHDAGRDDIARAAARISTVSGEAEEMIFQRRTMAAFRTLIQEQITELSWNDFFNVLQNYFITPIQRFLSGFNSKGFAITIEMKKELSETHTSKDLQPIIDSELEFIKTKSVQQKDAKLEFARTKLAYCLKQWSALLPYKNKIRPIVVPGKEKALFYIQKAMFYGPLASLLDSGEVVEGPKQGRKSAMAAVSNPSASFILEVITSFLTKYRKEKLSYDEKEIKNLIAIRDEKERVNVVAEFNKLSDEERSVELMNKRLGIGKWAVGGTKLIYAYDKDYYDQERQKRMAAGIVDFSGSASGELEVPSGRDYDDVGLREYRDEEYEQEGGYDQNQHADDDAE